MPVNEDVVDGRRSLEDVHGTVPVSQRHPLGRLFAYLGPAYLVSVGYMDPGNWATDLEGGARFGYALIWVLLMSNAMALVLQTLSARLGVVTGHDLAQACRAEYSRPINIALWFLAEIAIAACDLAEVVGTVIALKLLFGIPMLWGCLVTALDTFVLLWLQRFGMKKMEAVILVLVLTIGGCFLVQIFMAGPDPAAIVRGAWPSLPPGALFVAIGILGATVMPHNLYLHSALVQTRRIGPDRASKAQACRYNLFDSAVALNLALLVNASILIVSAAVFHGKAEVASIEDAHRLLAPFLGAAAPILFGVALLCAGQSSTLTGTLAGQIIMEGYLDLKLAPWLRRVITRSLALVPAVVTLLLAGEGATQHLLVMSQVVLSMQLAFAVIPLIHFTSNRRNMGEFATPWWGQVLAWISAAIIVSLNLKLVLDQINEWVDSAAGSGIAVGPIPLSWVVAGAGYGLAAAGLALLGWVTVKPFVRPSPAWKPAPSVELDWVDALRPRPVTTIGVALEHGPGDAEILSRALSLAQPGRTSLVLLHVVDTVTTRMYGAETRDRETDADNRYLSEVADVLTGRGYATRFHLLHGPDRAGMLVGYLRKEPVDLLVVGSHGHRLVSDLLFGQTVDKVRHGLSIPMLVARPERTSEAPPAPVSDPLTSADRLS
ncbi:Nramp family divalent metal transporter [Tundrisphaera sp. TA3]|uniref:Nramp family divalent metal transporter n=1 Tax=Tundrisphaera sp. TA3 TaxID=3435775 RepID=UPI003EB94E01